MAQQNVVSMDRKAAALRQSLGAVVAGALAERLVVEVMVNPDGKIWVDRIGTGREYTGHDMAPADAERILRLLADHSGAVVTRDSPRVSATLPETGERFQGEFPPIVRNACFAIRKRPEVVFTLDNYVESGTMSEKQATIIRDAADNRENMLIVGGTGSGKTTLANAVLALPAFANDRVFLIEDTAELQCSALDKVELLTKPSFPPVTMTDLVRDSLRLRPDRIVVGEVRDGCALDVLKAWNTGHPGGLTTIHANSAHEGLTRFEDLVAEVTARIPYRSITQAINVVIFIKRSREGRRIENVARLTGHDGNGYVLSDMVL